MTETTPNRADPAEKKSEPSKPAPRLERRPLVQVLRGVNIAISRLYHRTSILSPPCLPRYGAGILVCNHISGLDPLLIQSACSRVIIWMMAAEYYRIQPLNWFFRQIEAIPVERTGRDTTATRLALRTLQNGRILGVFPEGRIETAEELLPFQTGVAMMAIKTGVPIYPAYLEGTQRGKGMVEAFRRPNKSILAFGRPYRLPQTSTGRHELEAATAEIKGSVQRLMDKYRNQRPNMDISSMRGT